MSWCPTTRPSAPTSSKACGPCCDNFGAPGQTIFAAWKSYAIMNAAGVVSFHLANNEDDLMDSPGHMAVLGSVVYD